MIYSYGYILLRALARLVATGTGMIVPTHVDLWMQFAVGGWWLESGLWGD